MAVGLSVQRKEGPDKVTGAAKYLDDQTTSGLLHAWMLTSPYAHARIKSIDTSGAASQPGILAIITGNATEILTGPFIEDRPPIARGKIRHYGEIVAVVVAHSEKEAMAATGLIKVEYEPLPVVNSVAQAMAPNAPLVHEWLGQYSIRVPEVKPELGTNVADRVKIRKGEMAKGWAESEVIVEETFELPQSNHGFMETRTTRAQILPDGQVVIDCSSQGPFIVKSMISKHFKVADGKVTVNTPLVGGAFGGKTPVHLEYIAVLASQAVGGRPVRLVHTREQDFHTGAQHIGVLVKVKLGATRDGKLKAAELHYMVDCGAYTDSTPDICRAIAGSGTGPYKIDNVWCDSLCVYTNHPYTTAFRGFGHIEYTTAVERTMDKLAFALNINPMDLRLKNAVGPGDVTPTMVMLNPSRLGDLPQCIEKLKTAMNWQEGQRTVLDNGNIRAKGIACFWKTSSSPTDAISGAYIAMNKDGSVNLMTGVVEIGPGTKTTLAQIVAQRLKIDVDKVHISIPVNTTYHPYHWKTVASMSTYMAGNAALEAADLLIQRLMAQASIALHCAPGDLSLGGGRIFLKNEPNMYIEFKDLAHGFKYPNGNGIGGQIMGSGSFIMKHLTTMDPNTGKGNTGPYWTVGAQGVEVELEPNTYMYRILKAYTVIDVGRVLNPMFARGVITGGMCMGLGYGSRETLVYSDSGTIVNCQFRTYHLIRYGEQPEYVVEFVEAPNNDGPYGMRGLGEHGIVGMPGALLNALSTATRLDLHKLPATPEAIWQMRKETHL